MNISLVIGTLAAATLGVIAFALLRTFFASCVSLAENLDRVDLSWRDYRPIQRLLDQADFEYLRRKGISESRIRKLRAERRRIFRICLRSLARDFNLAHRALTLCLVQSHADRPELAAELATQRLSFYRNLMFAEFRLTLDACGISRMPAIDLLGPLQVLQSQLRQFAPAGAAA